MRNLTTVIEKQMTAWVVWRDSTEDLFELEFFFCNGTCAIGARCYASTTGIRSGFNDDFAGRLLAGDTLRYALTTKDHIEFEAHYAGHSKVELRITFRHERDENDNADNGQLAFLLQPIEMETFFSKLRSFSGQVGEYYSLAPVGAGPR